MKILALEAKQLRPLTNTSIQIQIKGKDSGYLTCTTDDAGYFQLDDKYKGQQIAHYMKTTSPSSWLTVSDKSTIYIDLPRQPTKASRKTNDTIL